MAEDAKPAKARVLVSLHNHGEGHTWPQREAEKLRKAMEELQSLQKSLRDGQSKLNESQDRVCVLNPPPR